MPDRVSTVLGISSDVLEAQGAFDGFYRFDSKFHIDPALLRATKAPELNSSAARIAIHFTNILRLLDLAPDPTSPLWAKAVRLLTAHEVSVAALGYAADGAAGRAIGPATAEGLASVAHQIIRAGVKDPVIFELVGLFQEGIGADMVSDMTLAIILPDVLNFNERVIKKLRLNSVKTPLLGTSVGLPATREGNQPVLLLPADILSPLPVAYSWESIDIVASYNDAVRRHINSVIGNTWRHATNTNKVSKKQLRDTLLAHPELLEELIRCYKGKPLIPYNFNDDPLGELVWQKAAESYAATFPLALVIADRTKPAEIVKVVRTICDHFKVLIESNGLFQLLYDQRKKLKPERAAQLLFFGIADAYCRASNLDLSPESNSGRGPVDFKISSGYAMRLNVEVKYSSNNKLVAGFQKQLPTYDQAEKSFHSIYLILRTKGPQGSIKRLEKLRNGALADNKRSPDLIVVDARIQPSASKL
jgi:hypothetical protein